MSRILLAVGFIPPALVKIQGHRFTTTVDLAHPIGAFFEAMYRTGAYWRFLGWAQLAAGVCLLIPCLTTLGAVLFFPLIVNVFVITVALHFAGTPVVTGLMLLANAFLLAWDYDRLRGVFGPVAGGAAAHVRAPEQLPAGVPTHWSALERGGYALGTAAGLGALLWTRRLVPHAVILPCLLLGLVAAGMVAAAWLRAWGRAASPARA